MTTALSFGPCFRCAAPAVSAHFYDEACGFFAVGEEPRVCAACDREIDAMSKEERAALFGTFTTTPEPPRGRNALEDALMRNAELHRRAKA